MNEPRTKRDLVSNGWTMWLLWGLPIATIIITSRLAGGGWVMTAGWTLSLLVMGGACLVNARGCGRMHCYFTGPFFLFMAVVTLLHGSHALWLGPRGWSHISTALLFGSILLCVVPEWLWGRYRRSTSAS